MSHADVPTSQNTSIKKVRGNPSKLRPAPPWPKGVSGNPGGRPKEIIRPLIRELVGANTAQALDLVKAKLELTVGQSAAALIVRNALKGETVDALRELVEQCDGRQAQAHTGADGSPLIPDGASTLDQGRALLAFATELLTKSKKSE